MKITNKIKYVCKSMCSQTGFPKKHKLLNVFGVSNKLNKFASFSSISYKFNDSIPISYNRSITGFPSNKFMVNHKIKNIDKSSLLVIRRYSNGREDRKYNDEMIYDAVWIVMGLVTGVTVGKIISEGADLEQRRINYAMTTMVSMFIWPIFVFVGAIWLFVIIVTSLE